MNSPVTIAAKGSKGTVTYPVAHKVGMRVTPGGSKCGNCEYVSGQKCENKYFQKWNGSDVIPAPVNEYCCDFWEPKD